VVVRNSFQAEMLANYAAAGNVDAVTDRACAAFGRIAARD